jgi:imidazolonepropionase-like amidohydrolase
MDRRRAYRADAAFDGERPIPGGVLVLVAGEAIVGVESGTAPVPGGYGEVYRPGTTLLPGLIDAHTHLCGNDQPDALDRLPGLGPDELDATVTAAMSAQLANGITAVRDLGDQSWTVVERHRGRPDGPTVVASGPPITSVDGHCASMGGQAHGVAELRRAVRERADRGADLVKIMTSGGVMTRHTRHRGLPVHARRGSGGGRRGAPARPCGDRARPRGDRGTAVCRGRRRWHRAL